MENNTPWPTAQEVHKSQGIKTLRQFTSYLLKFFRCPLFYLAWPINTIVTIRIQIGRYKRVPYATQPTITQIQSSTAHIRMVLPPFGVHTLPRPIPAQCKMCTNN